MSQTGEYPTVTEQLLDEVVRRVLQAGSPRTIVLFGSCCRGDFRPDSDLDLLILEDSELPRYQRSPRITTPLPVCFQPRTSWFTHRKR